jgi:hypothetical protein
MAHPGGPDRAARARIYLGATEGVPFFWILHSDILHRDSCFLLSTQVPSVFQRDDPPGPAIEALTSSAYRRAAERGGAAAYGPLENGLPRTSACPTRQEFAAPLPTDPLAGKRLPTVGA